MQGIRSWSPELPPTNLMPGTNRAAVRLQLSWAEGPPRVGITTTLMPECAHKANSPSCNTKRRVLHFYSKTDDVLHLLSPIYHYYYFYFSHVQALRCLTTRFSKRLRGATETRGKKRKNGIVITTLPSKGIKGIPSHIPLAECECS